MTKEVINPDLTRGWNIDNIKVESTITANSSVVNDPIQYKGADSWNEYAAEVDFGFNSVNGTGNTMIYMRHSDEFNWIRVVII